MLCLILVSSSESVKNLYSKFFHKNISAVVENNFLKYNAQEFPICLFINRGGCMKSILILITSIFLISACSNSSSSDGSNNGVGGSDAGANITYATYELIEGCSTGVKKITAANEADLQKAFCESLKDNAANGNCANYQREAAFKNMQCEGAWPHAASSGYNSSSTQSYSFRVNSCNTGFHYFSSSNSELGEKAYCKALLDDELNQNCGREKRQEQFDKSGCKL